jgi:ABC-type glycerol-3-phosphate transport system permease component
MPIILQTERKNTKSRLLIAAIYVMLVLGSITMIYPFLITVVASFSNPVDYHRFSAIPRSIYSQSDRFVRGLARYYHDSVSEVHFPNRPSSWTSLLAMGEDLDGIDRFAEAYLRVKDDPETLSRWRILTADYADFFLDYDIQNTFCRYDFRDLPRYLEQVYLEQIPEETETRMSRRQRREAALQLLNTEWGIPYEEFFDIELTHELNFPMHHPSWDYPDTPKVRAYLDFKDAYRRMIFRPNAERQWRSFARNQNPDAVPPWPVTREHQEWWPLFKQYVGAYSPASPTRPFSMKNEWLKFLQRPETMGSLGLDRFEPFTVDHYNQLFEASYLRLTDIPFPLPADAVPSLQDVWRRFVETYYPARLMHITVTPELEARYRTLLRDNFRTVAVYNDLMHRNVADWTPLSSFDEVSLPSHEKTVLWRNFVRTVPVEHLELKSAEQAWQEYLLSKYSHVQKINQTYGWNLERIEEAPIPFAEAYTITFLQNEWRDYASDILKNYVQVVEFMFVRGRAFFNTTILVILTILATLTVNPLAAYALSRFRLKWKEQILLFLIATMAFPSAVQAIPGFLLMRDLGLLNTYAALVLPGLANGMSIFILKCFFDGLPRELYEAASIDGASELQVMWMVTLPLTKPILAINSLNAFIQAYNSWEWALIVCQDQQYWTLAVWLYQMQMIWQNYPYVVMAGFVIASIPTAIVFISCQKIILRGIVIPSMK